MSSIDFPGARWRKSSYSNGQANCVETAAIGQNALLRVVANDSPKGKTQVWSHSDAGTVRAYTLGQHGAANLYILKCNSFSRQ